MRKSRSTGAFINLVTVLVAAWLLYTQVIPSQTPAPTPTRAPDRPDRAIVKESTKPTSRPEPTEAPTQAPTATLSAPTAMYPTSDLEYTIQVFGDQQCVVALNRRLCLSPGATFNPDQARQSAGLIQAGAGDSLPTYEQPSPIPQGVCTMENAPYSATIQVEKNGVPIGEVRQASCVSQEDADAKALSAAEEMRQK